MAAPEPRWSGRRATPRAACLLLAGLVLAGCATVPPVQGGTASTAPSPTPTATRTPSPTPCVTTTPTATPTPSPTPTDTPRPSPTPTPTGPPPDTRTGREGDQPYRVSGIVVVSREHPISRRYRPADPSDHGLERAAAQALARMTAAAADDGVRLKVRSAYRSWAEQDRLLKKKIVEYGDEKLARRYNAEPGKSEHQTGLAVDLWDGVTWGTGVRNTRAGKWLWKHSREYGFILRYPPGKEQITGYAYEPWHFRYIGEADSRQFKPNHTLTLEEYLGLA